MSNTRKDKDKFEKKREGGHPCWPERGGLAGRRPKLVPVKKPRTQREAEREYGC